MILDKILTAKKQDINQLETLSHDLAASDRNFLQAIQQAGFGIIAEMKHRSPSEGELCQNYHPADRASAYQAGGATALSILTDKTFFGGDYEHITLAAQACQLPILCKDFIIDVRQIYAARAAGANACLLIVRILTDAQLTTLKNTIEQLNMTALVEVFDEQDLSRALAADAKLIGVNNRNLDTLEMDTTVSYRLQKRIPNDITFLSLSGVKTPQEVHQLKQAGMDGVLMGTCLMRAQDPTAFLQECVACS